MATSLMEVAQCLQDRNASLQVKPEIWAWGGMWGRIEVIFDDGVALDLYEKRDLPTILHFTWDELDIKEGE